ncbi:C-type lectin domain family 2 member B-like isoform X2 [Erythrolamprus reginae]
MHNEKRLLGLPSSGSPGGQEEEPARVKLIKHKLWSTYTEHKKEIIGIVVSHLIFGCFFFLLGALLPLSCQQDVIDCPPDWIAYQGHCYKFSREEKNWKESQNLCVLHNASLAKITEEEMSFIKLFTRPNVFWIGLRREPDQPWKWLDGENSMLEVMGNGGDCAFVDDGATTSSGRCNMEHRYICKKK